MNTSTAQALSTTHEGFLLFPSKFDQGVKFEIAKIYDKRPVELGPTTLGFDCITVAVGAGTTGIFDMPDRQVLMKVRPGSLMLMTKHSHIRRTRMLNANTWIKLATDLSRLRNAASFGEQLSHDQQPVFGVVDTHVAQMLWLIFDEAERGYPSGTLLTEAACLSILGRAYTIGRQVPLRAPRVPKLSRLEKALIQEVLDHASRDLTTASISMELGRHPIDFDRQFEATFGRSLQEHLVHSRTSPSHLLSRSNSIQVGAPASLQTGTDLPRWFAPPVEDPRTWNLCREAHRRDGNIALVLWQRDCQVRLLRRDESIAYAASKGSLDVIAADTVFDSAHDADESLPAIVIPIESARLATMGLRQSNAASLLQTTDSRLIAVTDQLIAQWNDACSTDCDDVRQICELLIGYLSNLLHFEMVDVGEPVFMFRERERIWVHIAEHLSEGNSSSDLLQITGHARQTFAELFKATFGTTTHQFVLDRMIDTARFLLRRTSLSLIDIAMECGFASHAHLTTTFSMRVGCKPSAYRSGSTRRI